MNEEMTRLIEQLCNELSCLPLAEKIAALNNIRTQLHQVSPFKNEPVDLVLWEKAKTVEANDYNPNSVAPPEMKLLQRSILEDGYTQPIVAFQEGENNIVVDGFHRQQVGQNCKSVAERIHGYLPITKIRQNKEGRSNRMASTIRHNRARGTHSIDMMRDIVAELVESGMSDQWILKHIGMDADELLRLKQISGLASLFTNHGFSRAWVTEGEFKQMGEDNETR
jgi:ParB-like chromosome segregation protein Spo0J